MLHKIIICFLLLATPVFATVQTIRNYMFNGEPGVTGFCSAHKREVLWEDYPVTVVLRLCSNQNWDAGNTYMGHVLIVDFISDFPIPPADFQEIDLINAGNQISQRLRFDYVSSEMDPEKFVTMHFLALPEIYVHHISSGAPLDFSLTLSGQLVLFQLSKDELEEISAVLSLEPF